MRPSPLSPDLVVASSIVVRPFLSPVYLSHCVFLAVRLSPTRRRCPKVGGIVSLGSGLPPGSSKTSRHSSQTSGGYNPCMWAAECLPEAQKLRVARQCGGIVTMLSQRINLKSGMELSAHSYPLARPTWLPPLSRRVFCASGGRPPHAPAVHAKIGKIALMSLCAVVHAPGVAPPETEAHTISLSLSLCLCLAVMCVCVCVMHLTLGL